jgi:hypothetical protein
MLETLIFRAEIDKGSNILLLLGDVHAAACGIEIEGLRPFDASRGFFDSLGERFGAPFFVEKISFFGEPKTAAYKIENPLAGIGR